MLTYNWARYQSHYQYRSQNGATPNGAVQQGVERNGSTANGHGPTSFGRHGHGGYTPVDEPTANGARRRSSWFDVLRHSWQFMQYVWNVPFELERVSFNNIEKLTTALASRNIQVLHNRTIHLCQRPGQPDGVDLHLAGVDDVTEGTPDLCAVLADIPPGAPKILLSHHPDILEDPISRQLDLILSGHTHGGQIVLPWVGAAHTQSIHLSRHEAAGYLRRGNTQVYVSRGIGEGIPLRFGARPQITLLTVMAE
jgi:hypothetical protein